MRAEDDAVFGGVAVRKGTIAAFLGSVRVWSDPATAAEDRATAERDMVEAIPPLRAAGLLDVFEARDQRLRDLIAKG